MRILILFALCLPSCHVSDDPIIIVGHVSGLPTEKLFLVDAYDKDQILDSTTYSNGEFKFSYNPVSSYYPRLVRICFYEKSGKRKSLAYTNTELSTSEKEYGTTSFMLERGVTRIDGKITQIDASTNNLRLNAGMQHLVYSRLCYMNFGAISKKDTTKRKTSLSRYRDIIAKYPFSFYLLDCICNYRLQYTNDELLKLIEEFDPQVRRTPLASRVMETIDARTSAKSYAKETALDAKSHRSFIVDSRFDLNILIFWASWCGPCRKEIPELKILYSKYSDKKIRLASISLDEEDTLWKKALWEENMPWQQYIIDPKMMNHMQSKLNFHSIPTIIITNGLGHELIRFSGFDEGNTTRITNWVRDFQKKSVSTP